MTKRRITPHKGGRTARAHAARMTPQEREHLDAVLQQRGVKYVDWFVDHVEADYAEITGGNTMAGYDVLYCSECGAELPQTTFVYRGGPDDSKREVTRGKCYHDRGDGSVTFVYYDFVDGRYIKAQ